MTRLPASRHYFSEEALGSSEYPEQLRSSLDRLATRRAHWEVTRLEDGDGPESTQGVSGAENDTLEELGLNRFAISPVKLRAG